jgi:hypothetical protein
LRLQTNFIHFWGWLVGYLRQRLVNFTLAASIACFVQTEPQIIRNFVHATIPLAFLQRYHFVLICGRSGGPLPLLVLNKHGWRIKAFGVVGRHVRDGRLAAFFGRPVVPLRGV